jgi:dimethylargininase
MLTAFTRGVSPRITECELTFIDRATIDFVRAVEQHSQYEEMLRALGVVVHRIPADDACPDCCFLEDTALVLDEIAVLTRPGSQARRAEVAGVAPFVREQREVVEIEAPATLEGGDVLRIGRELFVGVTTRTTRDGIDALQSHVEPHGYKVHPVDVPGALHLKSVCTAVDAHTILADASRVDLSPFAGYEVIQVPAAEWMAANVLLVGGTVCMHSGFEKTIGILRRREFDVRTTDISEFLKAEAGLTCMSLVFERRASMSYARR